MLCLFFKNMYFKIIYYIMITLKYFTGISIYKKAHKAPISQHTLSMHKDTVLVEPSPPFSSGTF